MSTADLLGEGLGGLGGFGGGYTSTFLRDPAMAAALRKQQMGEAMMTSWKPQGPVLSPWQGVDSLVKGLMGGYLVNQGDSDLKDVAAKRDAEKASQKAEADQFTSNMSQMLMGGQPQAPTPQSSGMGAALSGQPQLPGQPTAGVPLAQGDMPPQPINSAIHQLESGGRMEPGIVGDGGAAAGPMQVHQAALDDVNKAQGTNYTLQDMVQKPEIGKAVGDAYTGILQKRYPNRPDLVLAAYNGGMGNVDRGTIPPATREYMANGMRMLGGNGSAPMQGTQYAGPGVPQDPQGQMPPQAPAAGPDPEAMMARAAQIRQAAFQASQHNNPGIAKQAAYMEHYADSLERQAQALQARTERRGDRQDAYAQRQADAADRRAEAAANRVPQTVTMQDPDGPGVGIYERTPTGVGKRLGNAPKQPGENSGPFGGNAMEAQANNILLGVGPKIANGTATDQEKGQYSLAYQHLQNGNVQMVPDPTDPSGNRQVLARIPGNIPPQFPPPPGSPAATPQPGAQPGQPPMAQPGAPQVVPGTTKFAPIPEKIMEGMINNSQAVQKIDMALDELSRHEGSVGPMNSVVPGMVRQYTDPAGVKTRALIADIGSLKLHDRSGAAVTDAEMAKLKPFVPSADEAPNTIREKLKNFRQEYTKILGDTYSSYGPKSGGRPLPEIEKTLSGGQQQMAAAPPSPDAVQAELRRRGLLK